MNIEKKEKALFSPDIQLYHQDYIVEHQRIERWDSFNQDSQVDNTFLYIMNCILCSKSCGLETGPWSHHFAIQFSVWRLFPDFHGYAQQDAQEFLCELLNKIQHELEIIDSRLSPFISTSPSKLIKQFLNVVTFFYMYSFSVRLNVLHVTTNCIT